MAKDFWKDLFAEVKKTRIGKVFVKGASNTIIDTIEEAEDVVADYTKTKLRDKTKKMKDVLREDDDGEKEEPEDINF